MSIDSTDTAAPEQAAVLDAASDAPRVVSTHCVLHDSEAASDPNGHGGNHRTAQIAELVTRSGLESTRLVKSLEMPRFSWCTSSVGFLANYGLRVQPSYFVLKYCGLLYKIYTKALTEHRGARLLLWEATKGYSRVAPYAARKVGFKVVAVPQNLEALVPGQVDPFTRKSLPSSLSDELDHLSQADRVFCISREEQWLLNAHGIDADFLPYYPPQAVLQSLLDVRRLRARAQAGNRYLILGTADNKPTFLGMTRLLTWLGGFSEGDFTVDIAGYGTEELAPLCQDKKFTLHGAVSAQQLQKLLVDTRAVLVYQQAGAGALTRVPEMLVAGIPVIVNGNAARSAQHYAGLHCFENPGELAQRLASPLASPEIPARPEGAERRFIECLQALAT